MNDLVNRQIDENRASYQQLLIESLLPLPQNLVVAAVHVENSITYVVNNVLCTFNTFVQHVKCQATPWG